MLSEAKLALRISGTAYDAEIAGLLDAAARDLRLSGVVLPGTVAFAASENGMVDESTLTDPLVQRALITYAAAHRYGESDADRLLASYEHQKEQLMHSSDYTDYDDGE